MTTLCLNLLELGAQTVELRYYPYDQPLKGAPSRRLTLADITEVVKWAETEYYTVLPGDLVRQGRLLYEWLDGAERVLTRAINDLAAAPCLVLAITAQARLAHLPWELLHDGTSYLVQRALPIVPMRWSETKDAPQPPSNRPLHVLFMAADAEGIQPRLNFEQEEARILEATKQLDLALTVEESGNLQQVGDLMTSYDEPFEVCHITGHATHGANQRPCFVLESDTGQAELVDAEQLGPILRPKPPRLLFLSGCRTAESPQQGVVPSLAQAMLQYGVVNVLGWGRPIDDEVATQAAARLYQGLAKGGLVAQALADTYCHLIEQKANYWHLLRWYSRQAVSGALVTPPRAKHRQRLERVMRVKQYLDEQKKVAVANRFELVGRRRLLQQGIRWLRDRQSVSCGLLLYGMGGVGKTSLTSRLIDRLTREYDQALVWYGRLDEALLIRQLSDKVASDEARARLQQSHIDLKYRLKDVLTEARWLFLFDDFEQNFEQDGAGHPRLTMQGLPLVRPEVMSLLEAVLFALQAHGGESRLLITSRYALPERPELWQWAVPRLDEAGMAKKLQQLLPDPKRVRPEWVRQAVLLADNNPRLLEWLIRCLFEPSLDHAAMLAHLAAKSGEFRADILAQWLLAGQAPELRELLGRLCLYELPVPYSAVQAVAGYGQAQPLLEIDRHLRQAEALGLVEYYPPLAPPEGRGIVSLPLGGIKGGYLEAGGNFYVSRILQPLLPTPPDGLATVAAEALYQAWWEGKDTHDEAQALEIHRLAIQGQRHDMAIEIAQTVTRHWNNRARWREVVRLCEQTMRQVGEDYRLLHQVAKAEDSLGETEVALAHFQQAEVACPESEVTQKSAMLHNRALIHTKQGEIEQAMLLYQQVLTLNEQIGEVQGKTATLAAMAQIYLQQGQVDLAMNSFQEVLKLAQQGKNYQYEATILHEMAGIYAQQGEIDQAMLLYQQALTLQEQIGDVQGKAITLHNMAGVYADQGQIDQAMSLFQQSLTLNEQIGDVHGKAMPLVMMGQMLAYHQGRFKMGMGYLVEAQEILARLRSPEAAKAEQYINEVFVAGLVSVLRAEGEVDIAGRLGRLGQEEMGALWARVQ